MKFIRLPNGDFVDPEVICGIRALDTTDLILGGYIGPRTVVDTRTGGSFLFERPSFASACELRDHIFAQCEEGRP